MQNNLVVYKTEEERKEIIELLKEKYKNNPNCVYREISEAFILPDKKWVISPENLVKILTRRRPDIKIYSAEVIKNALLKN